MNYLAELKKFSVVDDGTYTMEGKKNSHSQKLVGFWKESVLFAFTLWNCQGTTTKVSTIILPGKIFIVNRIFPNLIFDCGIIKSRNNIMSLMQMF